jgi:hypothetical protein
MCGMAGANAALGVTLLCVLFRSHGWFTISLHSLPKRFDEQHEQRTFALDAMRQVNQGAAVARCVFQQQRSSRLQALQE